MFTTPFRVACCTFLAVAAATPVADQLNADSPKENSGSLFLIQEGYNQDAGELRHVTSFERVAGSAWALAFSQEHPLGPRSHSMYVRPAAHANRVETPHDLGDIVMHFTYQGLEKGAAAFSPQLSLVLPTRDMEGGVAPGAVGYQLNVPFNFEISEKWVSQWNAGATFSGAMPGFSTRPGLSEATAGFAITWVAREHMSILIETSWKASIDRSSGRRDVSESLYFSPGLRFSWEESSGLGIVPGIAFPIGFGPSKGDLGVMFYVSIEHPFASDPGSG